MYAHGLFPFMLADVDFLITLPDGSTGILECKTTAMSNKEQWEDGAVPFHYELQVRHYLAVMNLDVAYIACLYGNNDASFVYQRIERDLEAEEDLIQREKEFWESYVLPKTEPPYIEDVDLVLNSLQRYMAAADQAVPEVVLDGKYSSALSEYLQLAQKKSVLAKQVEKLEQCQKALYLPLLEQLGSACKGVCTSPTGEIYDVSYKPSYCESFRSACPCSRKHIPDGWNRALEIAPGPLFADRPHHRAECLYHRQGLFPELAPAPHLPGRSHIDQPSGLCQYSPQCAPGKGSKGLQDRLMDQSLIRLYLIP